MKLRSTLLALALCALPVAAGAAPLLAPDSVPADVTRSLAAAVRADRPRNAEAYRRVADLASLRPEVYRRSRAQRPTVTPELRALGPTALLPMLDALAVGGYPRALTADESAALRLGLLEAVGGLGDPRALPVLRAVFRGTADAGELRAAARGLARVCEPGDRQLLEAATGVRAEAARAALGVCRSPEASQWLAAQLDAETDAARAVAAARGFAEGASSWGRNAVESALRLRAARAMVRRWIGTPAEREAFGVALLAMGGAEALSAVREAMPGAPPAVLAGLRSFERALLRDRP